MPVEDIENQPVAVFLRHRLSGTVEVHLVLFGIGRAFVVPVFDPVALDLVDRIAAGTAVVAQLFAVPVGAHHGAERILLNGFGDRRRVVVVRMSRKNADIVPVEQFVELPVVGDVARGTVAARGGDMHAEDNQLVLGDIFQVLFQPRHLRLGNFGGIVGRTGVEHVVEHDEMAVADIVRIIGGAERRTETMVGLRVHADGLVVVVVADHLEDRYADLPDLLLVNAVERHVVPHQVAQRNAVNRLVQLLLYVGHQQRQHLLFEHDDLVVAADLHVGQRQQGKPLLLAGALERKTALHDIPRLIFL